MTDTFPAAGSAKTIPYPTGFTSANCMIVGINFYNSVLGWIQLPNDYTKSAEISLLSAGVRVKTTDSGLASTQLKIMLIKIV